MHERWSNRLLLASAAAAAIAVTWCVVRGPARPDPFDWTETVLGFNLVVATETGLPASVAVIRVGRDPGLSVITALWDDGTVLETSTGAGYIVANVPPQLVVDVKELAMDAISNLEVAPMPLIDAPYTAIVIYGKDNVRALVTDCASEFISLGVHDLLDRSVVDRSQIGCPSTSGLRVEEFAPWLRAWVVVRDAIQDCVRVAVGSRTATQRDFAIVRRSKH